MMLHEYFLLTYSVSKVGNTHRAKEISDAVRVDIGKLKKLSELETFSENAVRPFTYWQKLEDLETAIKGLIRIEGSNFRDQRNDVISKFSAIFRKALVDNEANSRTTVIKCAVMTESLGDTIEFEVIKD